MIQCLNEKSQQDGIQIPSGEVGRGKTNGTALPEKRRNKVKIGFYLIRLVIVGNGGTLEMGEHWSISHFKAYNGEGGMVE